MLNVTDDAGTGDAVSEPSRLESEALYNALKGWFKADMEHSQEWRAQAKSDFDFRAGKQWRPEDKSALEDQKRPVITFNRSLAIIKAVAGLEINARHDTVFLPRGMTPGAVKANELLTSASQWMGESCDAEDEQSEAFQDAITCGMGWTEQRIGYDEEPDGAYVEQRADPLEMFWDRSARSKNLADARRVARVRKMTVAEAKDFAASLGVENVDVTDLDASWAIGVDTDPAKPVEERRLRLENSHSFSDKDNVHIVHMQWIERKPFYRVADQTTGRMLELNEKQYSEYVALAKEHGLQYRSVRQTKKVYKQAFLGGIIIGGVTECPCPDRFTFQCITGERDHNSGTWFGLISLMRDPQMWANKWLSQTLHILNTTAKGGIIAEKDAFADQREAQDTYAQPDAITWAAEGAIGKNKIMQKPGTGIPNGYVNLIQFAISSIRDVTGINLELLGQRDANQPGILEHQRKQAGMTILATVFDSLRRFRKNVGRVRLSFIQQYLSDGRLIRIAGPDGYKVVPLLRDQTLGEYEVIIDDSPTSPNQKQETWGFLLELMPMLRGIMTPEAAIAMLEYSPLPSQLVEQFKAMIMQKQAPSPEAQAAKQIQMRGVLAKVVKDEAAAEEMRAKASGDRAQAILDLADAAAKGAQADLDRVRASIVASMHPVERLPDQPHEHYGETPQGQQFKSLPSMPYVPAGPNGPHLPPQLVATAE